MEQIWKENVYLSLSLSLSLYIYIYIYIYVYMYVYLDHFLYGRSEHKTENQLYFNKLN